MRSFLLSLLVLVVLPAGVGAAEWQPGSLVTPPFRVVTGIETAVDANGGALAVWVDSQSGSLLWRFRPAGGAFDEPPENVVQERVRNPSLATDPAGNALVAWIARDPGDRRVRASFRAAGGGFAAPVGLVEEAGVVGDVRTALSPTGEAIVAWTVVDPDGTNRLRAAVRPAGAGAFGAPETIGSGSGIAFGGLGTDANGNALVAWFDSVAVHVARRPAGGVWLPAQDFAVTPGATPKGEADLEVAPQGTAVLAFTEGTGDSVETAHTVGAIGSTLAGIGPARILSGPFARDVDVDLRDGGPVAVAWRAASGSRSRVQAAVAPNAIEFDPTQTLSARNARLPRAVATSNRRVTVGWQRHYSGVGRAVEAASRASGADRFPAFERVSRFHITGPAIAGNARGEQFLGWTRTETGLSRAESAKASSRTGRFGRVLTVFDGRVRIGEEVDLIELQPSGNAMLAFYRRQIRAQDRLFWDLATYAEPRP